MCVATTSPDATFVAVSVSLVDPFPDAESVTRASLVATASGEPSPAPLHARPTVAKPTPTTDEIRSMVSSLVDCRSAQGNDARLDRGEVQGPCLDRSAGTAPPGFSRRAPRLRIVGPGSTAVTDSPHATRARRVPASCGDVGVSG